MLRKAQGLRNNVRFKKVFISHDRTIAQRVEQRQLVTQLKEQAADDSQRRESRGREEKRRWISETNIF